MGKNIISTKRSLLAISRQNALKNDKKVLYTRRIKNKRFKNFKELDPDPYTSKGDDYDNEPEDDDQKIPFKVRELIKYQNGKSSIYKPKHQKVKDETFVKQGKKESDRDYIRRTTVDFYKTVQETKSKISNKTEKDEEISKERKVKRKERLKLRKALKSDNKFNREMDKPNIDHIAFGDFVTAPPKFTVKPKLVAKKRT